MKMVLTIFMLFPVLQGCLICKSEKPVEGGHTTSELIRFLIDLSSGRINIGSPREYVQESLLKHAKTNRNGELSFYLSDKTNDRRWKGVIGFDSNGVHKVYVSPILKKERYRNTKQKYEASGLFIQRDVRDSYLNELLTETGLLSFLNMIKCGEIYEGSSQTDLKNKLCSKILPQKSGDKIILQFREKGEDDKGDILTGRINWHAVLIMEKNRLREIRILGYDMPLNTQ